MDITYESAMRKYFDTRREIELAEAELAVQLKPKKEAMKLLTQWMETKAREQGLKNVPVEGIGTGYWTTSTSAKVANPSVFWDFVKTNNAYDLVENRASSKAVKSYIDANGVPVPGVDFSMVETFKIRAANEKE